MIGTVQARQAPSSATFTALVLASKLAAPTAFIITSIVALAL